MRRFQIAYMCEHFRFFLLQAISSDLSAVPIMKSNRGGDFKLPTFANVFDFFLQAYSAIYGEAQLVSHIGLHYGAR